MRRFSRSAGAGPKTRESTPLSQETLCTTNLPSLGDMRRRRRPSEVKAALPGIADVRRRMREVGKRWRIQSVNATHSLNISAGVWKACSLANRFPTFTFDIFAMTRCREAAILAEDTDWPSTLRPSADESRTSGRDRARRVRPAPVRQRTPERLPAPDRRHLRPDRQRDFRRRAAAEVQAGRAVQRGSLRCTMPTSKRSSR